MSPRVETQPLADLLSAAVAILTGETAAEGPSRDLLDRLGYLDGAGDAAPHRAALLRAGAGFQRIFSLRAEDAPGLVALGAEVDAGCLGVRDALGEEPREKLAGLFWSEFSEQNARATLRQAIHEFREALRQAGCFAVVSTRTTVGLRLGSFTVDLDELLSVVAAHEAPEALLHQERLAESLLAGFDDLDPAFHVWLMARRQALHDRLIRGLEEGYRDPTLDPRQRRRLAEATLPLDPMHEEAWRIVMRCAAEAGETGAAIRAYDELYRLLDEDYDMEPSAATPERIAEVKLGKFDRVAAEAAGGPGLSYAAEMKQALVAPRRAAPVREPSPMPMKPALFIDRFGMSGIGPDSLHLVEGFRIELIACLTRFREWYVVGTAGADADRDVRVSDRYGRTTTAYQAGSAINVVMVLQERPSGRAIRGERFELRLDQWFEVQQRIVRRVAATLNVQLSTERLVRMSHMPNVSAGSYDTWLRGQWVMHHFDAGEWNRAVEMFAQGIEQEPSFSPLQRLGADEQFGPDSATRNVPRSRGDGANVAAGAEGGDARPTGLARRALPWLGFGHESPLRVGENTHGSGL